MANKFKKIDPVEFSFFFFKILIRLTILIIKKRPKNTIPNNKTTVNPSSMIFGIIFHYFDRFFNFINVVKNHQQTYNLYRTKIQNDFLMWFYKI